MRLIAVCLVLVSGCAASVDDVPAGVAACDSCTNDRDCAAGLACDHEVWVCKAPEQFGIPGWTPVLVCQADCAATSACTAGGQCHLVDGKCVARSDEDCERSLGCDSAGLCRWNGKDRCVWVY